MCCDYDGNPERAVSCLPVFSITLWCSVCLVSNTYWRQPDTGNTDENIISNLQGWCQTIWDEPEIQWLRNTFSSRFPHWEKKKKKNTGLLCDLLVLFLGDCKNRHSDQRHIWDWWEEKEFISSQRKWVCGSRLSKSKVGTGAASHRVSTEREPGAEKSPEVANSPPMWASMPSAGAINV